MRRLVVLLLASLLTACGEAPGHPGESAPVLRLADADGAAAGLHFVDLGEVEVGQAAERTLTLQNVGTGSARLDVVQPEGPFALTVAASALDADASVPLVARFTPDGAGQREAIASIVAGDQRIDLRLRGVGRAGDASCLSFAAALDFGEAQVGCAAPQRVLTVTNGCSLPAPVTLEVLPADAPFGVVRHPPLPVLLEPGGSFEAVLGMAPAASGPQAARLRIGTGSGLGREVSLQGSGLPAPVVEMEDVFGPEPRVPYDVLVVLDDSEAMVPWHEDLSWLAGELVDSFEWRHADLRLGVTTTSFEAVAGCGGDGGLLLPAEAPEILTHQTPGLRERFASLLDVEGCVPAGAGRPIDAALGALEGFGRAEAELLLILLAAEEDRGTEPVNALAQRVHELHPGSRVELRALHPSIACGMAEDGRRIVSFADALHGTTAPICDERWTHGAVYEYWPAPWRLRELPVDVDGDGAITEEDLVVEVDGELLPQRNGRSTIWSYEPATNRVDANPYYRPGRDARVVIRYVAAGELECG